VRCYGGLKSQDVEKNGFFAFFWKNDSLRENVQNSVPKVFIANEVLCSNFVKSGRRKSVKSRRRCALESESYILGWSVALSRITMLFREPLAIGNKPSIMTSSTSAHIAHRWPGQVNISHCTPRSCIHVSFAVGVTHAAYRYMQSTRIRSRGPYIINRSSRAPQVVQYIHVGHIPVPVPARVLVRGVQTAIVCARVSWQSNSVNSIMALWCESI